ncbi:hypothetical protein DPMN_032897 [Dreissena polymorpha]|uniref:Cadherin domain-containing protein n=1 Tax=Dreissena polymorpha TaxID=45954 RepID=A0A9D4RJD0_DREPO|nr:hypothetical protein DPMN_032897 [Dreissena polymorpha]
MIVIQVTIAGIVHATDEDGTTRNNECQYFIFSGAFDHFSVNSSSGEVYVKPGANLDRETRDLYTITIIAIDTGSPPLTGTTMIQVKIKDVNDKSPTFSGKLEIKIDENKTNYVSESFIQINATDEDENKELVYSFIGWKGFDKNNKEISGYDTEKIKV